MSATRPDALAVVLSDLRAKSHQVERDYRWLFPSGYQARIGGRGGNGGPDGADVSRLVVATEPYRRLLDKAARKVAAAKVAMADAADALSRLADLIDEGESRDLPDLAVLKTLGSWGDNRDAGEAALAKRRQRGAGLPGSDYGLRAG